MKTIILFLLLLFCMALFGFFSGIESGMRAINRARLLHWAKNGIKPAILLHRYLDDMQRFLATVLVGNNLTNVTISILTASLAGDLFAGARHPLVGGAVWEGFIAISILYFCEYLPKLLFTNRPLRRTVQACRFFRYCDRLLAPVTNLMLWITRWLTLPTDRENGNKPFLLSREYFVNVITDRKSGADISALESVMIRKVFDLQNVKAADIMTPIRQVTKVSEETPLSICFQLVRDSGHIRLPVLSSDGTRWLGMVDAFRELADGATPDSDKPAGKCVRPLFFVRGDEPADNLLPRMRRKRSPMLFVRDSKTGEVIGILTEATILDSFNRA